MRQHVNRPSVVGILFCSIFSIATPYSALADKTFQIEPAHNLSGEVFLKFTYNIDCQGPESKGLPGFMGTFLPNDSTNNSVREVRFDLFQGKNQTWISLGLAEKFSGGQVLISTHADSQCDGEDSIRADLTSASDYAYENQAENHGNDIYLLAVQHSPYLVVRNDQYKNRGTDIPLDLVYSEMPSTDPNLLRLRYTYFFSDEDSKPKAHEVQGQMDRYARMTDVEWIYEVDIDRKTQVRLTSRFQGTVWDKFRTFEKSGDHSTLTMQGSYYEDSNHPILYNVANNNVFSDRPYFSEQYQYVAYQPGISHFHQVEPPLAREAFQFSDLGLYMFLVSEIELRQAERLPARPSDYLFWSVTGEMQPNDTLLNWNNAAFNLSVKILQDEQTLFQGFSNQSVDRLGEDLFGKNSYVSVYVGQDVLDKLDQSPSTIITEYFDSRRYGPSKFENIEFSQPFRLKWNSILGRYEKAYIPPRS